MPIRRAFLCFKSFARDGDTDPFETAELSQILIDAIAYMAEKFSSHGIKLEIEQIPDVPLLCRAVQISQVVTNLIGNAFDAISDQPNSWVKIKVQIIEHMVQIQIIDSGSGISKNVEQNLFTPFYTTKPAGKGTGLGLSISMGIVKDHGGRIFIDKRNKNTAFVVELPIAVAA